MQEIKEDNIQSITIKEQENNLMGTKLSQNYS